MKTNFFYLIAFFLFITTANAQIAPNAAPSRVNPNVRTLLPSPDQTLAVTNLMNYQAVARDASGNILANQLVGLRFTIEDGFGGSTLYQERQQTTTNQFGLLTVKLGNGTVLAGTWAGINWSNGNQWLKVDMDPTGGSSYTTMGESELLSVPFANYSVASGDNHWSTNGTSIWNNNSGNVGIGTAGAAIYDLTVNGPNTLNPTLNINGTTNPNLLFSTSGSPSWDITANFGTPSNNLQFYDYSTATAAMQINPGGFVGVGINPAQKFHVYNNSTTPFTNNLGLMDDAAIVADNESDGNGGSHESDGIFAYAGLSTLENQGVFGGCGSAGFANVGVIGYASAATVGTNYAIYGNAAGSSANDYAGYFNGQVGIGGMLTVNGQVKSNYDYPDFLAANQHYLQSTQPFPALSFIGNSGAIAVEIELDGAANTLGVYDASGVNHAAVNASAFNVTSDARVKNTIADVQPSQYESYLTQIRNIESATYFYNNEQRENKHVGFIAQSLPKEVVNTQKQTKPGQPENLMLYSLSDMMGLNVIGIKALDSKQTQLEKEIADLKAEIQQLKNNK